MTGKMVLTYLHQLDPGIPIDLICRRLYDYSIIGRSNLDPSTAGVAALSLLVPGQQGDWQWQRWIKQYYTILKAAVYRQTDRNRMMSYGNRI